MGSSVTPMVGQIQRYVVREVVAPLGAWLAFLFLLLWVMSFLRGTDVLLGSAVTLGDLGRVTVYLLPHFLAQAAPPAFLLALLLGFGRLADDRELTAMQALGIGPVRLATGPFVLSVGIAGVLLALACTVQPVGLVAVRELAHELISKNLSKDIRPGVFHDALDGFTIYTEHIERDGSWQHVLVNDDRDSQAPLLMLARSGQLRPGQKPGTLNLELGPGQMHQAREASDEDSQVTFERGTVSVGISGIFNRRQSLRGVREEQSPQQLWALGAPARAAFHWRLGQAFMPVAFAFVGVPLGLLRRGGGRARGAVLTLAAFLGYYVLARVFLSMGERGVLPAWAGGELTNLLFIAFGGLLLWRLQQRGSA